MSNIFLVEDHEILRRSLKLVLDREADLEVVVETGSVKEARNAASRRQGEVDVAILDLLLPDGSGAELIQEMREANPNLRVLVLTLLCEHEDRDWVLATGANEVLTKFSTLDHIMAEIRRLVREAGVEKQACLCGHNVLYLKEGHSRT